MLEGERCWRGVQNNLSEGLNFREGRKKGERIAVPFLTGTSENSDREGGWRVLPLCPLRRLSSGDRDPRASLPRPRTSRE